MSRNSDRRKIKDVRNLSGSLTRITALQPIAYKHMDEDPAKPESTGFVAQDFAVQFPRLIRKRAIDDGVGPIKDPVWEKPKPQRPPVDPANPGNQTPTDPAPTDPTTPTEPAPEPMPTDPGTEPVPSFRALAEGDPVPTDPTEPTVPPADPTVPPADPAQPPADPGNGNGNPNPPGPPAQPPEPPFEPDPVSEPVGGFHILSFEDIIPDLVGAIKELKAQVDALQTRVVALENRP